MNMWIQQNNPSGAAEKEKFNNKRISLVKFGVCDFLSLICFKVRVKLFTLYLKSVLISWFI
jgi:hypothetical protein